MKVRTLIIFFVLSSLIVYAQKDLSKLLNGKWVDLTYSFEENSVYWPTNKTFKHTTVFEGMTEKGYFYSSYDFSAEEHGGTHFDAPIHFGKDRTTIEKIPVEQLMGNAVVIDISKKAENDRDYQGTVEDILNWEKKNGKIPDNSIVLLFTGFGKYYYDKMKYMGTDKIGQEGVDNLHFPALHPDAAKWLVEKRNIKAFGLDTPSIDYGQSKMFETHRILCGNDVTSYENVANLDKLPAKGAFIIALPMKIKGGSGAPLRIIALLP